MKRSSFIMLCIALVLLIAVIPAAVSAASSEESPTVGAAVLGSDIRATGSASLSGCGKGGITVTLPEYAFAGTTVTAAFTNSGSVTDAASAPGGKLAATLISDSFFLCTAPGTGYVTYSATVTGGCKKTEYLAASAATKILSTDMEIRLSAASLTVGESITPTYNFTRGADSEGVENVTELWSSAYNQLTQTTPHLTVDGGAVVVNGASLTAVAPGTAVVTAAIPGTEVSASVTVTVTAAEVVIPVTTLALPSTASVKVGDTLTLTPVYAPANATNAAGSWSMSASGLLTVSGNTFSALKAGKVTVTYTLADSTRSVSCIVTVIPGGPVPVTGVSIPNQKTISVGEKLTIDPVFSPKDASNQMGTWVISDESIVSRYGNVFTGLKAGEVNVIFTTQDGNFSGTCKIIVTGSGTVTPEAGKIKSVTIDKDGTLWIDGVLHMKPDDMVDVIFDVDPDDADVSVLKWTSSAPGVVTAYQNTLTAMGPGSARITVSYGGKALAAFDVQVD